MPNRPHEETYEQWADRKLEIDLSEFYAQSLVDHPELRNYSGPSFPLNPVYLSSKKKSIHAIVESISVAVGRCDYESFKKLMGPSLVPFQIMHNQKSQQLYWNWLQYSRAILFYRRAEYLFWGAQKKFFYEELLKKINVLEEVRIANPAPGTPKVVRRSSQAAARRIQIYKETILPDSFGDSQLQVDVFVEKLQASEDGKIKELLDELAQHQHLQYFRTKQFRTLATSATRYPLAAILRGQLFIPESMTAACMQKDAPPFLIETYRRYLTRVDVKLQKTFMHWLNIQFNRELDVALIGRRISDTISEILDKCDDLLDTQAATVEYLKVIEEELLKRFHDDHIKKSGIANLALQDQRFNVVDKEKKAVVPMLHFALRMYADAIEKNDALQAFSIVKLLISRGASPFQELEVVPFEVEKTRKESAFGYANLEPNWEILLSVLRQTIVYTPFAEQLRIRLENYAFENAQAPNAWATRIFQSKKTMDERLSCVSRLAKLLQSGDPYDDGRLLREINYIMKHHTSHFVNSKLHRLLKNSLVGNEILCVFTADEMEMEMQPLDLKEDGEEPQSTSPQPYALAMRSIFSHSSKYMQLSVATESKEEVDDLELDDGHEYSPSF
jgi:hypothetical protein